MTAPLIRFPGPDPGSAIVDRENWSRKNEMRSDCGQDLSSPISALEGGPPNLAWSFEARAKREMCLAGVVLHVLRINKPPACCKHHSYPKAKRNSSHQLEKEDS